MRRTIIIISILISTFCLHGQNVGIGSTAFTPDPSAGLEVQYSDKGMLIPRVDLSSITDGATISSPATSLLVYNTGTGGLSPAGFYYNAGTPAAPEWALFVSSENLNETAWKLDGNSGTTSGTDFLGTTDAQDLDIRTNNIIHTRISTKGQIEVLNSGHSLFIGEQAGENDDLTNNNNVFVGFNSGFSNTTGEHNTAIGYCSLNNNTTGNYNTATGCFALSNNTTGVRNTANGHYSMYSNTTGMNNTASGYYSLRSNTTGLYNTANGYLSMSYNTSGVWNTAYGAQSLCRNTTGSANTAFGTSSMYWNTTGERNTATGSSSLTKNTIGCDNTATGYHSMASNTEGNYNTAAGNWSLSTNTTGNYNTANGSSSLSWNRTGNSNTAIGYSSLRSNSRGNNNTAAGCFSLHSNSSASNNIAIGTEALYTQSYYNGGVQWSSYNVAIGDSSLFYNQPDSSNTGVQNAAIGHCSLLSNVTGKCNTANGNWSLYSDTTGSYNTALGYQAYYYGSFSYSTAIGQGSSILADRQVRIGNGTSNPATSIGGPVAWTTVSDGRFKDKVQENVAGLDFVMKLRPVTYNFDNEKLNDYLNTPDSCRDRESSARDHQILRTGFIAQEVEQAAKECGFEFSGVDAPKNEYDYYGLRYAEFVVPLVKATQEQQVIIEEQKAEIDKQKQINSEQQQIIDDLLKRVEALENSGSEK